MSELDQQFLAAVNEITSSEYNEGVIALPGDWIAKGGPSAPILEGLAVTEAPVTIAPLIYYVDDGKLREEYTDVLYDESGKPFVYKKASDTFSVAAKLIRDHYIKKMDTKPFAIAYVLDVASDDEEDAIGYDYEEGIDLEDNVE